MKLLLFFVFAIGLTAATPSTPAPQWKVGAASAKITPGKPMWMAGYAGRTKPSEGVEQDLFAKALVLEDLIGGRFALITMDLIGVPRDLRLNVAARVEKSSAFLPPSSPSTLPTPIAVPSCGPVKCTAQMISRCGKRKLLTTLQRWRTRSSV